ncbi:MAG: class I SAM-dependent methyltransferase, partial [Thermodesulfobacteriota bacterium]
MPETKSLFNRVAEHYDLLNTLLSFGMDRSWRRRLAAEIRSSNLVLDIATGTGEVAIEVVKRWDGCFAIGIDPSKQMLDLA